MLAIVALVLLAPPSWWFDVSPHITPMGDPTVVATLRIHEPGPDWYCPAVTFTWGDGTETKHAEDCPAFDPDDPVALVLISRAHPYRARGTVALQVTAEQGGKTRSLGPETVIVR